MNQFEEDVGTTIAKFLTDLCQGYKEFDCIKSTEQIEDGKHNTRFFGSQLSSENAEYYTESYFWRNWETIRYKSELEIHVIILTNLPS